MGVVRMRSDYAALQSDESCGSGEKCVAKLGLLDNRKDVPEVGSNER